LIFSSSHLIPVQNAHFDRNRGACGGEKHERE
jgi:hypothetical protein